MTNLSLAVYVPGIGETEEERKADPIVARIRYHLKQAEEMAALAKSALHKVARHHEAYDRMLKVHNRTKKQQAVIEKQKNLGGSYQGAKDAFKYHAGRVVDGLTELAALMPHLIEGGSRYNSTVPSYGRKSNAVLCSRMVKALPAVLDKLAEALAPRGDRLVWCGNEQLSQILAYLYHPVHGHEFDENLTVPYVFGVSPELAELDSLLIALDEAVARQSQVMKEFCDAKSRYFSDKWDTAVTPIAGAQSELAEFEGLKVDFEVADWSLQNANEAVWAPIHKIDPHLLRALAERISSLRPYPIVGNNIVAAKCRVESALRAVHAANALMQVHRRASEIDPKTSARMEMGRQALNVAFEGIPAVHNLPRVDCLGSSR
jgi:hypothetical protein